MLQLCLTLSWRPPGPIKHPIQVRAVHCLSVFNCRFSPRSFKKRNTCPTIFGPFWSIVEGKDGQLPLEQKKQEHFPLGYSRLWAFGLDFTTEPLCVLDFWWRGICRKKESNSFHMWYREVKAHSQSQPGVCSRNVVKLVWSGPLLLTLRKK